MHNNSLFRQFLLGFGGLLLLTSCDKDYNEIGADIVGDDHYLFDRQSFDVIANSEATGPVQSNNLVINPLGIYTNPVFGTTTANFVTQLEMATENPTFSFINAEPTVESVVLTIPYYSDLKTTADDGTKVYELDSLYGPLNGKLKLSIFRSGYYLTGLGHEENGQEAQRYYTDENVEGMTNTNPSERLNNGPTEENDTFFFSPLELVETTTDSDGEPVVTRSAPGMKLTLSKEFFQNNIVNRTVADGGNLINNNVFKNYFRGLYFKVEQSGSNPTHMAMLNFANGKITIKYKEDKEVDDPNDNGSATIVTRVDKTMILNLKGQTVSLQQNTGMPAAPATNPAGTNKIYLKGGNGSIALIDLFNPEDVVKADLTSGSNGIPDDLDRIRAEKWMINEANLVFTIDNHSVADGGVGTAMDEPNRIYLYDRKNKQPLIDYSYDVTTGAYRKFNKYIHDGIIQKTVAAQPRGIKYRVRITNFMRNLVKDSTNVKLGLAVTEDIAVTDMVKRKTATTETTFLPKSSVMSPLGTILYGNNIPAGDDNYDKRLKLEIVYTKPN